MEPKLRKSLEEALDAAEAMYAEMANPSTNLAGQWELFKGWRKKVQAGKRALAKAD